VAPGSDAGPAATGLDPVALAPAWGQLRDGLEKKQNEELTDAAVASIREDFGTYIEAIEKHPRLLIGAEVPRADGSEGMERIKDEADAKSWQDAIRGQLGNEVRSRVSRAADETRTVMTNIHAAIALFENNPDIIPKSKTFDKELADKFANMVEPYEFRVDGKLNGYTVPVQGFLTQLRKDLAAQRAAAATAATPPAPTAQQQRAAVQPRNDQQQFTTPPPGPQGGIQSKAGTSSDEGEDFSVLFGTLDPSLRDFRF
jgi:hypothetical protein